MVLGCNDTIRRKNKDMILTLDYDELSSYINATGISDLKEEVRGLFVHLFPGDDLKQAIANFASNEMLQFFLRRHKMKVRDSLPHQLSKLVAHPMYASLFGQMFEAYALAILESKQHISTARCCLEPLSSASSTRSSSSTLYTVGDNTSVEFSKVVDLASVQVGPLYYPTSKNFTSIDGLRLYDANTLDCYQMTVAASHPVFLHRLEEIWRQLTTTFALTKLRLIFVVHTATLLTGLQPLWTEKRTVYIRRHNLPISQFRLQLAFDTKI